MPQGMAPSGRGKGRPACKRWAGTPPGPTPANSVTARLALLPDSLYAGPPVLHPQYLVLPGYARTGTDRDGAPAGVTGKDAGRPGTAMGEPGRPGRFRLPFRMPGDARAPKGAGWPIPQKARPSWCALGRCGCGLAGPARPDFCGKGPAAASCEGSSAFVARASPGLVCDIRQVDENGALLCAQTRTGQPGRTFSAMTGTDLPPQGGRRGMGSGPGCVPSVPLAFQTFGTTSPGLATPSARATWRFTATKLSGDTEIESIPALTSSLAKAGSLLGA